MILTPRVRAFRKNNKDWLAEMDISVVSPVCSLCANFQGQRKCRAFPEGIPLEIWTGENDHTKAIDGDNGILFEQIELKQVA